MAFSPQTGLVYIPTWEMADIYSMPEEPFHYRPGQVNQAVVIRSAGIRPRGFLRAWDPVQRRVVWQVETTGEPTMLPRYSNGVMATAGGFVF